jgi:hypothetical protein
MKMGNDGMNVLLGCSTSVFIRLFLETFRFCVRFKKQKI